ncbi:MAG: transglutaminase-like domain-containing protein [bacterium]|nr:transglutaminase-like domain-containing protein [bacterium]
MKFVKCLMTAGVIFGSSYLFASSTVQEETSQWFGMYLKDQKVGYTQTETQPVADGYKISELTYIELDMMGTKRNLKSISQYEVNKNFELKNFTFNLETEAQKMLIRGETQQNNFNLSINTGGKIETKTITITSPIFPISVLPMLANKFTRTSQKLQVFDPSIQAVSTADCELLETKGDSMNVKVMMLNSPSTMWVNKKGEMLSQSQPMGITVKKESKEKAIKIGKVSPEILTLYKVPVNMEIKNARDISLLKMLVNVKVVVNEQQRWFGDTLLIETRGPSSGGPFELSNRRPDSVNKYLEPTTFIQSKDKRIIKQAKEIVGFTKTPWKKVVKLTHWVSENVKDMPTVTIPSALDVLNTMEGDCGEHSILFAALARACKIPADVVVGIVYTQDGFYYHAWNKVWVGRWVEVDPTFDEPIADAAHLILAEGGLEEQAKIMELVDKIKIQILEYK